MSIRLEPNSTIRCMVCTQTVRIDKMESGQEEIRYVLCYRKKDTRQLSYGTYCNEHCLDKVLKGNRAQLGCYVCMRVGVDTGTFMVKCPVNAMVMYRCCSVGCRRRAMDRCQELNSGLSVKCNICGKTGQYELKCPKCTVTSYCSEICMRSDANHIRECVANS